MERIKQQLQSRMVDLKEQVTFEHSQRGIGKHQKQIGTNSPHDEAIIALLEFMGTEYKRGCDKSRLEYGKWCGLLKKYKKSPRWVHDNIKYCLREARKPQAMFWYLMRK